MKGGERLWSDLTDREEPREVLTENPGHQMEGGRGGKRFETQKTKI